MLDLEKLEHKLEVQLAKETTESLTDYFNGKRNKPYNEVCLEIWGCIPVDKLWATNTEIYKEFIKNNL